ncbi:recombination protein RecR [Candidatus Nomurabacteria bacterium]|nr:recombination protein RecR [Candidatus Nomurabacteria bacterium]
MYSPAIAQLIEAFSKLPTVGKRTAERFVFHLLKSGKRDAGELTVALKKLIENVKSCEMCWNFTEVSPCPICRDEKRNPKLLCVVSEPQDFEAIEVTKSFGGLYHIIRGNIRSEDPESLRFTKIPELLKRIESENFEEVLLALNHNMQGELTMMFLQNKIKKLKPELKVTRLARGLPMGSDLQYADEVTLSSALENRR